MSDGSTSNTVKESSTVNVTTDLSSSGASSRIGYGLTGQLALTDHFAIAGGAYLRRMGYILSTTLTTDTTTFVNGVSTTTTTTTSTREDARARVFDFPLLLRYYGKSRHEPGPRWFVEGGGAFRTVNRLTGSLSSTDTTGTSTCCTSVSVQPSRRNSRGIVGGAGAQFIDPFGIRVVPEIRYTRWMNPIFDSSPTHMQQNQVEATLSLSF